MIKLIVTRRRNAGRSSQEEEKVRSWIYRMAQADEQLVFEYVRSTERGLSFKEAERRLKENGPNLPFAHTPANWWQLFSNAFFRPFNIVLIVLVILPSVGAQYAKGIIVLILVLVSVGIQFYQEYKSSKAAMKLSECLKTPVKVQRCAGRTVQTELLVQMDQRDVVQGDIISFTPGDLFPGDVRLLKTKELVVSQSSLTGESGTAEKSGDVKEGPFTPLLELKNICFMGTSVVSGSGTGLVVSTGSKTYVSSIFSIPGKPNLLDPFSKGLSCLSYSVICAMIAIAPVMVLADYYASRDWSKSTLFGASVIVALTPQMLPLIVTTCLAKGAIAMAKERCVVKSLISIQNMGAMDILCIDKTGTLTTDHAIMIHHLDSWGIPREEVLRLAFLNSYFKTALKSSIDDAISTYVYARGYRFEPSKWTKVDEVPFDFTRRRVSVIIETSTSIYGRNRPRHGVTRLVIMKGALVEVLKCCSYIEHIQRGEIVPLSVEDCERVLQIAEEINNDGLQVLGLAIRWISEEIGGETLTNDEAIECNMVFQGLLTFFDPPKASAKEALQRLADKGVKAKVLTGDSITLATKVCKEVGIKTNHVITGPDLELLSQDEFHDTVEKVTVFARLTPRQKLGVIQSLQRHGHHVVGYLGDGVNDSLALDAADVGISVDSGVSVAKELADIILLEKDLNVLVSGVACGRITYGNTMKYIKTSLIGNLGSAISLFIACVFLRFEPLSPGEILIQNFLYSLGQISIPWDKMDDDREDIPKRWSSKEFPLFMLWNGPVCSLFDIANLIFLCFYYNANKFSESSFFQSAWFVEGLLMQTLTIHMIRTEKVPFIQDAASWPVICSTLIISTIGIAIPFTPIGKVIGFTDLPLSYFGFLTVLFIGYFTVAQYVKMAYISLYKKWL
ncbi:unnamed protein product [Spirodela intermedia]|uniref:Magnesium-transporting ATPase, P-type 1 n=2 Tax=Spirodela intermedia TaxID=51605 RepID=A0A7I8J4F8_SPIIN|nr:unnamed protein product [Spirodela intermedia]CAA6664989.1 unnamed protein product [Spirodela intermedia]CAA7401628.1 unnamed protein product [Spirodela intermedia]